jgi:[ribosomal protein S5]-alanine N-acetyltransferase
MNITTTRLKISQVSIADAPFILKMTNTSTFKRFIGDRNLSSISDAEKYLLSWGIDSYEKNGFGPYIVRTIMDESPVGTCGLFKRDRLNYPDLGFAFLPEYTGFGYAIESARSVLNYGFNTLKIPLIYAITNHDNDRSKKLLSKLGFAEISMVYDANTKVFELKRESYI